MPRFMIKRTLPPLTPEQIETTRHVSTRVCNELGIVWIRSHLTRDGKYSFCEYEAENEALIWKHGKIANIPVDEVTLLGMELGPSTPAVRLR